MQHIQQADWPVQTLPKLRMITHFYQDSHYGFGDFLDTKITFEVVSFFTGDIYSIDLCAEIISWNITLAVEQVCVSEPK
jgi:hypothetical protein